MPSIIAEKVEQAIGILNELEIDAWLTFVRETTDCADPVMPLIIGHPLTWQSALILSRSSDRIAIIGQFDDEAVKSTGVWTEVTPYVQDVAEPLVEALRRIDPKKLAINFSTDDVKSDGLSHGMFLLLQKYLADTPYGDRLISSADIVSALRGRKSASEQASIKAAIAAGDEIFEATAQFAAVGKTEREVADYVRSMVKERGLGLAWEENVCPIVNSGPDSMVGHGVAQEIKIEPGHVFHMDFGVRYEGYCSDIQRCWYVPKPGETAPPEEVCRGFDTIVRGIQAAAAVIRPGVKGMEVDAAARQTIVDAGYPEFGHATGHSVGLSAHDGGAILGPMWERYGKTPERELEAGNVFTLEPSIMDAGGRGVLGIEEMIVVTETGCEFLSIPQTSLPLLP